MPESAAAELAGALSSRLAGGVRADPYTLHLYSSDASMYAIEPLAVVFPHDAEDIAAATDVARQFDVPVLARGAGTSLAGQAVARAIILDCSRHMNTIEELDPSARTARVQPGVVQDELNRAAGEHGLMFGADTSTSNRATLGGMIGNNSAGTHSIRYGMTIDHVHALDVLLSDASCARLEPVSLAERERRADANTLEGALYRELPPLVARHRESILRDYPPYWRHAGGYRLDRLARQETEFDLAKFVVGSEGTLVIVTAAEVGLVPRPAAQAIAVGHFRSTLEAIAATEDALRYDAVAIELIDHTILELARQKHEYARLAQILKDNPDAVLFVTFFGDTQAEVVDAVDRLAKTWANNGHGYHTLKAIDGSDRQALLKVRSAGLGLLMAASTGTRRPLAFVEDTAVPPDRLVEYVSEFTDCLDRHGMRAGFYGHCSVGCLHIRPFVDLRMPGEIAAMREVAEEILDLALRYGGVNSSEHGDGLVRSEFNRRIFGDELYQVMREVKGLFDPDNRLNPGKVVDAQPLTEALRDPALPPARPLTTRLRFHGSGMREAADRCMNIGLCRKTDAGVMCPSYMATRDEEHATRGRANALVKALSTADPAAALGDERLHGIMDLCLECKACKSECPLSVDMAKLKSEFLSQYQATHGIPLRSRAFGSIRVLNSLGAAAAPLSNFVIGTPISRAMLERGLGIASARPLPRFERKTLIKWFDSRPNAPTAGPRGDVVFLADSFTTFSEPAIGQAAVELLERAGWRVLLESRGCCGRSSISKGLLEHATRLARSMVDRLYPHAERGIPIVGCEPSCILTLRDEYRDLLPSDTRAEVVAERVLPLAELVSAAIDEKALPLDAASPVSGKRIVVHGHCHEKAVTGTAATVAMLERIPGSEVAELDAGCCGMAGSFGFEREHYDLSLEIGRLRLFPALAREGDDVLIAATGVSCRQQIEHGVNRRAHHPLELVRSALVDP